MIEFNLNGRPIKSHEDMNLLQFLRSKEEITSVKNGCSEGTCGACTVLVDGKKSLACRLTLEKVKNRQVITVEGLSTREKEVYSYAFKSVGAVQCGFCTPGMVLSAKALLDKNPNPKKVEVKKAINSNICRCTGYKKIEEGILLAAEIFSSESEVPSVKEPDGIGFSIGRVDVTEKILGSAKYIDDVYLNGMLHLKVLRSKYPRAIVKTIDISEASISDGVVKIVTAKDIPGSIYDGYVVHDWPVLVPEGQETHFIGDAIAVVAAETLEQAQIAVEKIKVQYEQLAPIFDPIKSMQENAPRLHPNGNILTYFYMNRGEPENALKNSAHVISRTIDLPQSEHAYMEPESSIAFFEGDILNVLSASQNIFSDHAGLCRILALPESKIRVRSLFIGGAFGGKEDLILQHHVALVTLLTGRPAKLTFTREESIRVHPKRHSMKINITLAADHEGNFTAVKTRVVADTGAYASLGASVLRRACTHMCGPYKIPSIELEGFSVYTNNLPAGAFRGFGVAQSAFSLETVVDLMSKELGIDPWELRYKNALNPGDIMGTGQIAQNDTAIKETLLAVKPYYFNAKEEKRPLGLACGFKSTGMGGGKADIGRVKLIVEQGMVVVFTSAQCIGQGLDTILFQIISETCGVSTNKIRSHGPDTSCTPNSNATTASRQTLVTGEAARIAATKLKKALEIQDLSSLEGSEYDGEYLADTDVLNDPNKEHPLNHVAFSYATNLVILDEKGLVQKVVAAFDVGRAINPQQVEGQIEGGVVMGLGYALTEKLNMDDGVVKTKFGNLGLFRALDAPEIVPIIIGKNAVDVAYSAKGIGEIATIPIAPAVANAYMKKDQQERLSLPLQNTPYEK